MPEEEREERGRGLGTQKSGLHYALYTYTICNCTNIENPDCCQSSKFLFCLATPPSDLVMSSDILPAEKVAPATHCFLFFLDFRAHLGVCRETDTQHGLTTPIRSYTVRDWLRAEPLPRDALDPHSWPHLSSQLQAKCSRLIPKEVLEETTERPQRLGAEGRRTLKKHESS